MRPVGPIVGALALVLGSQVASAGDRDELVDPWKAEAPHTATVRWEGPPVVDVVDPWLDGRPRPVAVAAPLVDPWQHAAPARARPGEVVDPWAARPSVAFPDIAAADRDPDGIVDPWPNSTVPTARFDDVTVVDPWARRH